MPLRVELLRSDSQLLSQCHLSILRHQSSNVQTSIGAERTPLLSQGYLSECKSMLHAEYDVSVESTERNKFNVC